MAGEVFVVEFLDEADRVGQVVIEEYFLRLLRGVGLAAQQEIVDLAVHFFGCEQGGHLKPF